MKKMVTLIMALALCLTLCACGGTKKTISDQDMEALLRNPLYETLKEKTGIDFQKQNLESAYSTSNYVSVCLNNCRYLNGDYTFKMGNGSKIKLPTTYGRLCDGGWMPEYDDEVIDPHPAGERYWISLINTDGKTMNAEICNDTSAPIDVRDTQVTQIQVGNILTEDFDLSGLTRGSTVAEVLDKFGMPCECSYYVVEGGIDRFDLFYIDKADTIYLHFSFDPQTNLLDSIGYSR